MQLQVVMPIGGIGSRFSKVGIKTPKPLIDVLGKPMFLRAIQSVEALGFEATYIFVIRRDQDEEHDLGATIRQHLSGAKIVVLKEESPGASSTVLAASSLLNPSLPLLVLDCDIAFKSDNYRQKITQAIAGAASGVLLSFRSKDPRYSFAKTDAEGFVTQTAEKSAISDHALMGSYFFTRAEDFIDSAQSLNAIALSKSMPEYYMSLTFNFLISRGLKISLATGFFYCFGTPEELSNFIQTQEPVSSS